MRIIMMTGEVNGIIESHHEREPSGLLITYCIITIASISGTVTGNMNCCVSASLSTADPIAANIAPYSRYPPMKKNRNERIINGKLMEAMASKIWFAVSLPVSASRLADWSSPGFSG